jgi:hypothetical protein
MYMMSIESILIILTFILVIIVILVADSLTTAMLIVSLLANFLVISSQFKKISKNFLDIGIAAGPQTQDHENTLHGDSPPVSPPESAADTQPVDLYGPFYEMWHAYRNSYDQCYDAPRVNAYGDCSGRTYNIDTANTFMAQRRARDKRAMDGWAVKDANFYKHHYGAELDDTENRVWWGRNEY